MAGLLLAFGGSASSASDPDSRGWTKHGRARLEAEACQKACAISFTEPVELRLVDALSRSGDENAAGEALSAYLALNLTNMCALRLAGYRNLDAKHWANAILLLERVGARIGYNDSIWLARLAQAYWGSGKHEKADEYAAIVYQIAPADAMVVSVYADVLKKSGMRPEAPRELAANALAQSAQSK